MTRLPRSLSPVQGMRNKSGPIVFFPPPSLPIVKYRNRFTFSLLFSLLLSLLPLSLRKKCKVEGGKGKEGREGDGRREEVVRKLEGKARVEANGVSRVELTVGNGGGR